MATTWVLKDASASKPQKTKRVSAVSTEERLAGIRLFLAKHPGATTPELVKQFAPLSKSRLITLVALVARVTHNPGSVAPGTWVLKNDHRKVKVNGIGYANGHPKKRGKSSLAMKRYWANMSERDKKARRAKMGAAISQAAKIKRAATKRAAAIKKEAAALPGLPSHDVRDAATEAAQ
jgi:hypothetical protein